jgi:hypothetical protein
MSNLIKNFDEIMEFIFEHPKNVCMTYTQHLRFSLYLSFLLIKYSFKGTIHSFYPDIYKTYAQDCIKEVDNLLKTNGCVD